MLQADITNNQGSKDEKPTHYANLFVGTGINEDGEVIYEPVGKFGVGLLQSRDVDTALIEAFLEDPDSIAELDFIVEIRSASGKVRKQPVSLVKRK